MRRQLTSRISILAASALALGTCLPAGIAFADDDPPSVGNQSGAGSTALTMVWENPDQEYGGTEDPNNPMAIIDPEAEGYDPTAPGTNLAFKAPTAINFVAKANGTLLAPQSGIHIDNYSSYGIRVSSMKIDQSTGWNIVSDASASSAANAVSGNIGPATDQLAWASYVPVSPSTDPIAVTKDYAWNIAATDGADGGSDELALAVTESKVANLNMDLSTAKTFGTIHWYLKAGSAAGPELPTTLNFEETSVSNFSAIGNYLRSGNANSTYVDHVKALVGQTVNVTLADESDLSVRLVSVDTTRGLTFESVDCLPRIAQMNTNETNSGGWNVSSLKSSLNTTGDNTLFSAYFEGTDLDTYVQTITNSSYDYNSGAGASVSSDERFWIPSANNIFGSGWPSWKSDTSGNTYSDNTNDTQFDYYAGLTNPKVLGSANSDSRLIKQRSGSDCSWWLRSAHPTSNTSFMGIALSGDLGYQNSVAGSGVVLCFCL